jgi:hypothetical protein
MTAPRFIRLVPLLAVLIIAISAGISVAGEIKNYKGSFTEIFYADESALVELNRRVSLRWLKEVARPKDIRELSLPGVVTRKFDVIRINVELILDMHPRGRLVAFNVLPGQDEVEDILRLKYGSDKKYKAFYSKRDKHIYIAADKVNTNVVAHELAHAVVDLELGSSVPEAVHEILARYVDAHLYD